MLKMTVIRKCIKQEFILFSHTIYVCNHFLIWIVTKKKKDVSFQMNCVIGESCKMDQLRHFDNSKSNKNNELAIQTVLVMIMTLLKITDGT